MLRMQSKPLKVQLNELNAQFVRERMILEDVSAARFVNRIVSAHRQCHANPANHAKKRKPARP